MTGHVFDQPLALEHRLKMVKQRALFATLADSVRLHMVWLLMTEWRDGATFTALAEAVERGMPTICHHINALDAAGILAHRRDASTHTVLIPADVRQRLTAILEMEIDS